jgi:hypothetical protein
MCVPTLYDPPPPLTSRYGIVYSTRSLTLRRLIEADPTTSWPAPASSFASVWKVLQATMVVVCAPFLLEPNEEFEFVPTDL